MREAEQEHRHHHQPARDDDVDHVEPRAREPVEGLARVVDRVEAPEPGHPVEGAVHPVLGEVGEHEDLEHLQRERLALDRPLQRRRLPERRQRGRRQERQEGERLDRQVAHHEVGAVGGPAVAEGRLLRQPREGALEGHEDEGEQEQVQQEPVEPERERLVEPALDRHAAAAGEGGGERQADADEPQDLAPAQDEREGAEQEREPDGDLEQRAQERHRVVGPERRRGEDAREPERQDAEERQRAEEHARGPRHPAGADVPALGVAEDAPEPALERRRCRHGSSVSMTPPMGGFGCRQAIDPTRAGQCFRGARRPVTGDSESWRDGFTCKCRILPPPSPGALVVPRAGAAHRAIPGP